MFSEKTTDANSAGSFGYAKRLSIYDFPEGSGSSGRIGMKREATAAEQHPAKRKKHMMSIIPFASVPARMEASSAKAKGLASTVPRMRQPARKPLSMSDATMNAIVPVNPTTAATGTISVFIKHAMRLGVPNATMIAMSTRIRVFLSIGNSIRLSKRQICGTATCAELDWLKHAFWQTLELTLRRGSTQLKIKCGRRRVQRIVEQAGVAGGGNVALRPTVDSAVLSIFYMEFHSRRS